MVGHATMEDRGMYVIRTRCRMKLNNVGMAGFIIYYSAGNEGFARKLPNHHVIRNILAPLLRSVTNIFQESTKELTSSAPSP
jgi:hypothetical protein